MAKKAKSSLEVFAHVLEGVKPTEYILRLYVTGTTLRSTRAIANVKKICEQNLAGHYELEVIDLYQQPERAQEEQIIAAPTLIRQLPLPVRRVLGDMSKTERVLVVLGIRPKAGAPEAANSQA